MKNEHISIIQFLVVILFSVTFSSLAEPEKPEKPEKLELILLQSIPSDAFDGRIVHLQTMGAGGCRYAGALESTTLEFDGILNKSTGLVIGNTDRFIRVTHKECGGLVETVSLLVPLARMRPAPDAGMRLTAFIAK